MDKFRIDSHKLIYHVSRVHKWLNGENVYPIYIEVGLHGGCNHKCVFCAFDYMNYQSVFFEKNFLKNFLYNVGKLGVKSILYSGEGEPLLNPQTEEIIALTKKNDIDVALSTNGVLLNSVRAKAILPYLSWMRVSVNAGTSKGYALVHGTDSIDFHKVMENLKNIVTIKKKKNYECTIGVQFLLLQKNYKELVYLVPELSKIGVDYLVIKPYSRHPLTNKEIDFRLNNQIILKLEKKLKIYNRDHFKIIFRYQAINKLLEDKPYKHCLGLSFITHVTAAGDVYPCNAFIGNNDFIYGNIHDQSFEDIWHSQRRKKINAKINNQHVINACRKSCRNDEINRYLWNLKNPVKHINFI